MASYKVAQDVEADDKLLGPFSFRQFIYLLVAAMAGAIAWGLYNIFTPLFIIPLPVVIFFLVLALPLRKDQPMEIYLAAIVSFYLKPRRRLWQPDGVEALIEITAPREAEKVLTKDIGGAEADRRLEYLAAIADTRGWSIRNIVEPSGTSMNSDAYNEAQNYEDMLDASGSIAQSFDAMISQSDAARRQEIINSMQQPAAPAPHIITPETSFFAAQAQQSADDSLPAHQTTTNLATPTTTPQFNPYPANMRQHVINPGGSQTATTQPTQPAPAQTHAPQASPMLTPDHAMPPQPAQIPPAQMAADTPQPETPKQTTSDTPVSPDIISLANNSDLSIETIAREAHRIEAKHKHDMEQEVVISLR